MLIFIHKYKKAKQQKDVVAPTVKLIMDFVRKIDVKDKDLIATILMKTACELVGHVARYVNRNPQKFDQYNHYINEIYEIYNSPERKSGHGE